LEQSLKPSAERGNDKKFVFSPDKPGVPWFRTEKKYRFERLPKFFGIDERRVLPVKSIY
jgi:hypothetical protein